MKTNGNPANGKRVSDPFPSSASCGTPPSGPVGWRVTDRAGKPFGVVSAQSWFAARAEAMATYRREAHELVVRLVGEQGAA